MTDFDALERANAPLNAFTDFDRSAKGGEGTLAELTVGVKANIAVKGLPWTGGSQVLRHRIADSDAEVVARLRDAGAAIIGSLNMEEAALGAKTDNPWFGATQNPHRPGYTPGGSSGGSGAAVAAGLCDAALGTDTMGSIRIPAAYCGIYGFKPAHASVSQDGLEMTEPSLDTIGPLARDMDVLERVSRVISDFGEGSAHGVAVLAGLAGVGCEPAASKAYEAAKQILLPDAEIALPHTPDRVRFAGFIAASRFLSEHLRDADPTKISPLLTKLMGYGPRRSEADLAEDRRVLAETRAALEAAVDAYGAILMPTAPQAAFPHDVKVAPSDQSAFTCLASIACLPTIAIPAGWTDDGLPVGVQLIGKTGHETGLFALARKLDAGLAAYRPPANFGY